MNFVTTPKGKTHRMVTPGLAYCGTEIDEGRRGNNAPKLGRCVKCEGMSWRRPRHRACRCGERWAAEAPVRIEIWRSDSRVWPERYGC